MAELRKVLLRRQEDGSQWPFLVPHQGGRFGSFSASALRNAAAMIPPYSPPEGDRRER